MRALILVTLLLSSFAFAQSEGGNHGDPYRKEWRRQKLRVRDILKKMTPERLLPNAAPEARDWLTEKGPKGESKFAMLEAELATSPLEFREVTPENPKGHNPDHTCGHTTQEAGAAIWISKVDCGKLHPSKMWEVLIGDAVHHFKFGDEFSDYVSMAIVEGYRFHAETDPTFALRERYKGIYRGKETILTIDVSKAQPLKLSGGLDFNLSNLPPLGGSGKSYGTTGDYSSFSYSTWMEGIGKYADTGSLGYGELEGTRRYHTKSLSLSLSIAIDAENDAILVTGWREKKGENSYDDKDSETFTLAMLYYPPTAEELEAKQIAANTTAFAALLDKKASDLPPDAEETAIQLYQAGVTLDPMTITERAIQPRFWKLVDLVAPKVPAGHKSSRLVYAAIFEPDAALLSAILSRETLKPIVDLETKVNYRTPLGNVIEGLYNRSVPGPLSEKEAKYVPLISVLLEAGVKTNQPMTDITNTPRLPLNSVVSHFGVSKPAVVALLAKMPAGEVMAPDERDRTALDYLTVYWNFIKNNCAGPSKQSPQAQQKYDEIIARYQEIYNLLLQAGHDGKRRGCIYYDVPNNKSGCEWNEKDNNFRLYFRTEYRTKPRNWSPGSQVPAGWDICG